MKQVKTLVIIVIGLIIAAFLVFASENFSNGERIGTITQFSKTGRFCKTWEGHLNVTQTGMNSSTGFDFSVDRDNQPDSIINKLDSAANKGWKVKLIYHQVKGYNWFNNRGNTDYFINDVVILDRNFDDPFGNKNASTNVNTGKVIDTVYIVITPSDINYGKFFDKKNKTTEHDTAQVQVKWD